MGPESGVGDIIDPYHPKYKVEEIILGCVTVAFALRWSEYFKEWSFVAGARPAKHGEQPLPVGTCVEGIRVEITSPGFQTPNGPVAIANVSGASAPKTNVARSSLEQTQEYDDMLRCLYRAYCSHVQNELSQMHASSSVSLTWAAQEGRYLLRSLYGTPAASPSLLYDAIYDLPLILVEREGGRTAMAVKAGAFLGNRWPIFSIGRAPDSGSI
jgi:hypothetical protein